MEVKFLHIEDSPADAWLLRRTLQEDGWRVDSSVVDSLSELLKRIDEPWDVVLADFGLPGFSTADALDLVRKRHPDLPFVIVSGQIGEENAVALMKAGANDYVSKNYPKRLSPILSRLLEARRTEDEKKIQRQRTRELENRFRQFFNLNLSGMAMLTPEGVILEINQSLLNLLGLDSLSLPSFWSLFASSDQAEKIQTLVSAGEPVGPELVELLKSDGTHAFLLSTFQLPEIAPLIWANLIDHTEEVKLQDQVFQIKKLEGLGHLAAGVAHEFNNVLAIIQGQFALLSRNLAKEESVVRRVEVIEHALRRGASVVKQLLVLARRRPVKKEFIQIDVLLAETCRLVQSIFPENVTLQLEVTPSLPGVFGDRDQLGQALLNLIVNAKDAMPEGGTIRVAALPNNEQSTSIQVVVSDEGSGIPPELIDKIFDPFFTTKGEGKGTGLGLSLVETVVRSHLGKIEVRSREPKGTSFIVVLPAASALDSKSRNSPVQKPSSHADGATILLIENERHLLEFEQQVLIEHGFQVVGYPTANEGWELLQTNPAAFSVVITDLGLPGLSGETFCNLVRTLQPEPKLVVQSGNIEPTVLERLRRSGVRQILVKPFSAGELLSSIDSVLQEQRKTR